MSISQATSQPMTSTIEEVHLVFKTHLDIGFTDYAHQVVNDYFTYFIPKAMHTAEVLRSTGRSERFIWTTGAWLIYEYLEHAAPRERVRMEDAILAGDIVWHAMPFTVHSELVDRSLYQYGLSLSQELDKRFGKKTIAAKMTDVPGHTRGILPLLAEAGIQLLHIGVNPSVTAPDVPPVFVWRAPGGEEVMVIYHHAYGGATLAPGSTEALALEMTNDNVGPPTIDTVLETFYRVRADFPGARVQSSTLDAFAERLLRIKAQLPVLTQEIGDTWIHGIASDPRRISHYRELCRLRTHWIEEGKQLADEQSFAAFSRSLLMVPEHTWGLDEKKYLGDEVNYSAAQFAAARQRPHFQRFEASWQEQREYLDQAIQALADSAATAPLAQEARTRLTAIDPVQPDREGFTQLEAGSKVFVTTHFRVGFDAQRGTINALEERVTGRQWASPAHPLALFGYQIFSHEDFDRFLQSYVPVGQMTWWVRADLTKPGMETLGIVSTSWVPQLVSLSWQRSAAGDEFLVEQTMPEEAVTEYGCPRTLLTRYTFRDDEARIEIDMQWFEKAACRLPEALWLSFTPRIEEPAGWSLDKLGQAISPLEVVSNGNRRFHAVATGLTYQDRANRLRIETLDAPLVAPGERSLLHFTNEQPPLEKGMHFNLFNNIFGSNFRMWYDEDARFRFVLTFQHNKKPETRETL